MSPLIAIIRREICLAAHCPHQTGLRYDDPCAACPAGHWGVYDKRACENAPPKPSSLRPPRPGEYLARLLTRLTGETASPHCSCHARATQMDTWGWWGCLAHRSEILSWLLEAAALHHPRLLHTPRPCTALAGALLIECSRTSAAKQQRVFPNH